MNDESPDLELTMESIQGLARMCMAISAEDIQAVLDEISRTESIMPLLDPTGYRDIQSNIPGHKRIVSAFLTFRKELESVLMEGKS